MDDMENSKRPVTESTNTEGHVMEILSANQLVKTYSRRRVVDGV